MTCRLVTSMFIMAQDVKGQNAMSYLHVNFWSKIGGYSWLNANSHENNERGPNIVDISLLDIWFFLSYVQIYLCWISEFPKLCAAFKAFRSSTSYLLGNVNCNCVSLTVYFFVYIVGVFEEKKKIEVVEKITRSSKKLNVIKVDMLSRRMLDVKHKFDPYKQLGEEKEMS